MKYLYKITALILCCHMFSCAGEKPDYVADNLHLANENAPQLKAVLDHYCAPEDSLKLRAAQYLISNMANKHSLTSGEIEAYDSLIHEIAQIPANEGLGSPRINNLFHDFRIKNRSTHDTKLKRLNDLSYINADFLINNIDSAFVVWKEKPWSKKFSFEVFCEYILPYRVMSERISSWRGDAYKKSIWWDNSFDSITSPVVLCDSLQRRIDLTFENGMNNYPVPQGYKTFMASHWGTCIDEVNYLTYMCRGNGVPVAVDFVPQWASLSDKHYWNVVLDTSGVAIPLQVGWGRSPGMTDLRERFAKIYRISFSIERDNIIYRRIGKEDIPTVFKNCNLKDVTADYGVPVTDITVKAKNVPSGHKIMHLCTSNRTKWEVVAFAEITNGKATFHNVATGVIKNDIFNTRETSLGNGIVLLPAYFVSGETVPAASPFILYKNGGVNSLTANISEKEDVTLLRKQRMPYRFEDFASAMDSCVFQGSNRSDFSDAVTIYTVKKPIYSYLQKVKTDLDGKFRYVRFSDKRKGRSQVGELAFYGENGELLNGKTIGSKERFYFRPKENAFDGDIVSFYASEDEDGWIGLDFGESKKVCHLAFCPRTDGNDIQIGDVYSLYFWADGWEKIDTKKASEHYISFSGVPKNALLLLRDESGGKEERIFTYSDGKQVWW